MTTLKPGQVLTGDSVKALKAGSSVLRSLDDVRGYRAVGDLLTAEAPAGEIGMPAAVWYRANNGNIAYGPASLFAYVGERDEEGWIAWAGGENPFGKDDERLVECRFGDGSSGAHEASIWDWNSKNSPIIAFRPLSTKPQVGDQGALQAQAPSVPTEQTEGAVGDWPAERQIAYWRKGHEIVEGRLAKAVAAKHEDAPFPMDPEQAAAWHSAQADAYRDALEMMGVPECVRIATPAIAKGGAS